MKQRDVRAQRQQDTEARRRLHPSDEEEEARRRDEVWDQANIESCRRAADRAREFGSKNAG